MTKQELQNCILILEGEKKDLTNQVEDLRRQVENLTEMLRLMQHQRFGSSSEKTPKEELEDQMHMEQFFNEAEDSLDPSEAEPAKLTREGKLRMKTAGKKGRKEILLKDIPEEEVLHEVTGNALICPQCGDELKPIGKRFVRDEVQFIPAKIKIIHHYQMTYECPKCKHTDKPFMAVAKMPKALLNHSLASPSTLAEIMHQKYENGVPLNRQEAEWEDLGLKLSRSVMANWINKCAEDYFFPLIDALHSEMLKRDILHCDETTVQVLKEKDKTPQSTSYMWAYRTGNDDKAPIVIYEYQPSRSGIHAEAFLGDFKGYLHTDGYSGYNRITSVTRCGCFAHLRRKFVEAIPPGASKGDAKSYAEKGRDYINTLFEIERELKDLSAADRFSARLKLEKPILDEFWVWLDSFSPSKGSKLDKAVSYALNQKQYLEGYLKDGRCSISNNAAENVIRPFVIGRKNWLFADTVNGAKASAAVYSLIQTAKENGLNPRKYLQLLLTAIPSIEISKLEETIPMFFPWTEEMQRLCKD